MAKKRYASSVIPLFPRTMFVVGFLVLLGMAVFCGVGTIAAWLCIPRLRSVSGCFVALVLGGGTGVILFFVLMSVLGRLNDRNVHDRLSESDVIGTWRMTESSLAFFARDEHLKGPVSPNLIEFRPDGTCTFDSAMIVMDPKHITVPGHWLLLHDTTSDSSDRKKNVIRLDLSIEGGLSGYWLNFTHDSRGGSKLWNYYQDPDQEEYVEYTRNP